MTLNTTEKLTIGIGALAVLFAVLFGVYANRYYQAAHDVVIWNDSTYFYKNLYGEEYAAKNAYILKANELEEYNKELHSEYMALKTHPIVISKVTEVTKIDTVVANVDSIYDIRNGVEWKWSAADEPYYTMNGTSSIDTLRNGSTTIDNVTINSRMTLDVVDNGQQLAVYAKSDNPYVSLEDMQGVVIDPASSPTLKNYFKPKRWGFGPCVAVGVYGGYDFINKGPGVGVGAMVGFSLHYDIWQW